MHAHYTTRVAADTPSTKKIGALTVRGNERIKTKLNTKSRTDMGHGEEFRYRRVQFASYRAAHPRIWRTFILIHEKKEQLLLVKEGHLSNVSTTTRGNDIDKQSRIRTARVLTRAKRLKTTCATTAHQRKRQTKKNEGGHLTTQCSLMSNGTATAKDTSMV